MVELVIVAIVVIVLVLLNGLFVAAEFAVIAAPRPAVEARARKGERSAKRLMAVLREPLRQDRYIATAQIGITLASLGLGMYGEHSLAEWLAPRFEAFGDTLAFVGAHTLATITAVAVLTYLHIVVGEMVPKALALQYAERTALAVTGPMVAVKMVFYPLVIGLNALGNGVLRIFGVRRQVTASHYMSGDELSYIVEESREGGFLREDETRLLHESLDFTDLTAREVMVPRVDVKGVSLGASPEEMAAVVREWPHTRYPVFTRDLDHAAGVVHLKDLLRASLEGRGLAAADVRSVPFVPATVSLDRVLDVLRSRRAHMAVVVDEYGGTAGILTIEDLIEEIVGEIEEGPAAPRSVRSADGTWLVPGAMRLDEVGERLGIELEHPRVDTVSGLILSILGRPPHVGDEVQYAEVRFRVERVAGRGVRSCRVKELTEAGDAGPEEA